MAPLSFWGCVVKPGKTPTTLKRAQEFASVIIKQAALAPEGKPEGTSVLSVSVGATSEDKFVLCHLTPGSCDQWALDAWSAKEEKALADSLAKLKEGTPNRWERVAQDVGGGKTPSACKKHAKEMKK
ncbi:hypothetical protein Ctob_002754 [Chrysochromulina tobinii]|uniref:Uncharacterized protein n=1 Tax=Chrysochromulina tobinii TaxID=1460289 RepID=A0A0M0JB61_9EUKA|nr:hypothetical protein Ctob_002754 [Chrysochromulina tobinii]|eukprot:KOO23592.1 hypothetical protein Ctob_002754 [Chrysochromulina sp. CCMP291]